MSPTTFPQVIEEEFSLSLQGSPAGHAQRVTNSLRVVTLGGSACAKLGHDFRLTILSMFDICGAVRQLL